ncbi:MAG TPA: hypothetical protein VFK33_05540 [Bacillales bacterium]|nr:hypothetical protein [Bacillales bacterium]
MGALWFFFIGLILLIMAFLQLMKIRSFSFKNKRVIVREKMTLLIGGAGFFILVYGFLIALF